MQSINQQLKKAIFQSVLGRYGAYAVQVITMMVYARWFTPEQFGILAAIQVFTTFFMMLAEVGLGPALINLKELKCSDRDGLFTLTWIIGVCISLIFYGCTYILNVFYDREDYQYLGIPICLSIIFYTANTIPNSFLQRERKFLVLARTDIIAELPTIFFVGLIMKINPLLALSTRVLFISFFKFFLNYYSSKNTAFGRPIFGKNIQAIKPMLSFSLYQFGFNFLNFFSRNLDNILVGRYIGMSSLGIYDKAYTLMKYPLQLLTFAMTPAIQPVINQHNNNLELVKKTHDSLIDILSILSVIVSSIVLLNSKLIVLTLLGKQWESVSILLEILALTIPSQIIMSTSGSFFQALNRTDLLFKCGVFSSIINVSVIVIGIFMHSLVALTLLLAVSFNINFVQCYVTMYNNIYKMSSLSFFKKLSLPILFYISVLLIKLIANYYFINDVELLIGTVMLIIFASFLFKNKLLNMIQFQ